MNALHASLLIIVLWLDKDRTPTPDDIAQELRRRGCPIGRPEVSRVILRFVESCTENTTIKVKRG